MNEVERAKLREKLFLLPYERQAEILFFLIKDALLCERVGIFAYKTEEVLKEVANALATVSEGIRIRCSISGRAGAGCDRASISGAVCFGVREMIMRGADDISISAQINQRVMIEIYGNCKDIKKECAKIFKVNANVHLGKSFIKRGKLESGVCINFPYIPCRECLKPPSAKELVYDKYSVVRIMLHNLF